MQAVAPSKQQTFYVHKLRLEVNEGAGVAIRDTSLQQSARQGSWILAKFIGASLALAALLMIAARELAR